MNGGRRARELPVVVVLLLFTIFTVVRKRHSVGEDLSSSYVGCRILAAAQGSHLFAHDPVVFSIVRDPMWNQIADRASFAPLSLLHPYVQTPLWAYSLQPVCTRTNFRTFCHMFLLLTMLCTAGTILLVARYWAPGLMHPGWMALICAGLYLTEPFKYAIFLTQTHMIYVFLSVLALVLAERERPLLGGLSLALAAAVKITPGFLLLYWLITRQRKAALSFVAWSLLLAGLTVVTTGPALFRAYMHEIAEVSNVLLVSFNNQSFAAWVMGRHFGAWELFDWRIHHLPLMVKMVSLLLCVTSVAAGGSLDRKALMVRPMWPPYGAVFALMGATMFTPIAWSHYYILLILPLMLLLDRWWADRSPRWAVLVAAIFLLNVYPVAYGSILHVAKSYSVVRSQFYSGLLALVAMWLLSPRAGAKVEAAAKGAEPGPAEAYA